MVLATVCCVTGGTHEIPSKSGERRLVQDRPPVVLPQTDRAEAWQRFAVELDAMPREAEAQAAAEFAAMAAHIRRRSSMLSHADLERRRAA